MRKLICFLLLLALAPAPAAAADAYQTFVGSPLYMSDSTTIAFSTTMVLNANNDTIEWLVQAHEAATVTALGFLYGARTGTPPTYRISMQSVNTSGRASGTVLGGGSPASATFTPPDSTAWNGTFQWVTLTNSYNVARGEQFAIVIDYSSGTVDGSNNGSFSTVIRYLVGGIGLPAAIHVDAGTPTRQQAFPLVAWKSASKVFGWPAQTAPSTAIHLDTTPDEQAIRFNLPATWWSTYKVVGVRFKARANAATTTLKIALYSGTTELQNVTLDMDLPSVTTSTILIYAYFDEETLSTLNAGTEYRVGFAPQENTASFYLQTIGCASAGDAAAFPGGSLFYLSTRTGGGTNAWTDDTTSRPMVDLIISDITAPAGGGASAHTWVQ